MRFTLPIALLAASACAYTLPKNAEEGTYRVDILEDGTEQHVKLSGPITPLGEAAPVEVAERDTSPNSDLSPLLKRGNCDYIACGCGFNVDPAATDAANADLINQLNPNGSGIDPGQAYYSIRANGNNQVVAFVCVPGNSQHYFQTQAAYRGDIGRVTDACGRYVAGSYASCNVAINGYFETDSGYMQYFGGLDFCKAAMSSNSRSC